MLFATAIAPVNDKQRLLNALDEALNSWITYAPYLEFFRRRLRLSQAVPAHEVPGDVITMNSRFALRDESSGESTCYTLVYPQHEAAHAGKISALSPMGMALYGAKVGQEVWWTSDSGPHAATVERLIYQPEAAGHHNR